MEKKKVIKEIERFLAQEHSDAPVERKREIETQLLMYRFLPAREYGGQDVVIPSALVELEYEKNITYCLVVPQGGGLVTRVEGKPVQVITPNSPLGEALVGKKAGDVVEVGLRSGTRKYLVKRVS